ncbi:MAG: hypothetical protein ACJ8J0_26645 [Longimicrobiaceae bacterium]
MAVETYRCARCGLVNNALRGECKRCGHPANAAAPVPQPPAAQLADRPAAAMAEQPAPGAPATPEVPLDVQVLMGVLYAFGLVAVFLALAGGLAGLREIGVKEDTATIALFVFMLPVSVFLLHHGLRRVEAWLCGRPYAPAPRGLLSLLVRRMVPGAAGEKFDLDAAFQRMPLSDRVLFATVVLGVAGGTALLWSPWLARHLPGPRISMKLLALPPIACGLAAAWGMRALLVWMREGEAPRDEPRG